MMMLIFFPLLAGCCMMLHLPPVIHQVLLFSGYAVAIGTVARYSWIAAQTEVRLSDWMEAVKEACPPHQCAIIRHFAEHRDDD